MNFTFLYNGINMKKYKLDIDAYGDDLIESDSILGALADNRIFRIKKTQKGLFNIREQCDEYFQGNLTKEQLIELGKEIIKLAEKELNEMAK